MKSLQYPGRAHRRFLGLTLPPQLVVPDEQYATPKYFVLGSGVKKAMYEHLRTAGQLRGGILLGYQAEETLHITALLPNGYGITDPYVPAPQYVLGAVEAAQQHSDWPIEWVGNWLMPADTQLTGDWVDAAWLAAKERALLPVGVTLLTFDFAESGDRIDIFPWIDAGEGRSVLDPVANDS